MTPSVKLRSEKKRIVILTGASLASNPRALKEAASLASVGFDVVVFGSCADAHGETIDIALAKKNGFAFLSVNPASRAGVVNGLEMTVRRFRDRLAREALKTLGVSSRWQLGPHVSALLTQARKTNADYWIVHLEQAAWVGVRLIEAGHRVGVDIEDWYSEDLLPETRKGRPTRMLRELERRLLTQGAHSTCPSRAMSKAFEREYGVVAPTVLYNAFRWSDRESIDGYLKDRKHRQVVSIHWFSQTLGAGRGLEYLFEALPLLEPEVEVHLRGHVVEGFDAWLAASVPESWRDRIFVHELVSNEELLSRIAEHDIALRGNDLQPQPRTDGDQ